MLIAQKLNKTSLKMRASILAKMYVTHLINFEGTLVLPPGSDPEVNVHMMSYSQCAPSAREGFEKGGGGGGAIAFPPPKFGYYYSEDYVKLPNIIWH